MILGVWAQSALLVGCGLVAAGCAPSRWHQVTLSGTMQDQAGRPWPDANVILRPVPIPGGQRDAGAIHDPDGCVWAISAPGPASAWMLWSAAHRSRLRRC
jgi:hypothetical protein